MSAVSGVSELDRVFRELSKGMANKIARPGLAKAGRLAAKKVKASIPARYKGIRKAIKSRSVKTKFNGGIAGVKIGAGVARKKESDKDRSGKKGVGIGARNVHWWFVGTGERKTKSGKRTGLMPKQAVGVSDVVMSAKGELNEIIRRGIEKGIWKETVRQARKQL
jgi:hypothetical protein